MDPGSRNFLLRRARTAIAAALSEQAVPPERAPAEIQRTRCGLFVSLHTRQEEGCEPQLLGCIGHLYAKQSLDCEIICVAQQAAFADPRFTPLVTLKDLDRAVIEISLLSPFEPVDVIDTIEPGRHGLYITVANRSGLLLPQVARDRGWDRATFLRHLCIKAGSHEECWKDPCARLYRFTAEVFDENLAGMR